MNKYLSKIKELEKLIGNTPFIRIRAKYKSRLVNVYAKLEWYNFTGSIKDRVALSIIKNCYKDGLITPSQEIVEVTSGNTGISFAGIGNYLGHKVSIIMPDWLSKERQSLLKMYGANLVLVSKENGGFNGCFKVMSEYKSAFKPLQFENKYNSLCHYKTTGKEICDSLVKHKITAAAFVCGVGTGGSLIGVAKALKESNASIKICAVEPKSSPILKEKKKVGSHLIEGISDEFVPPIYEENIVSEILDADNEESILMAQLLCKKLGLGVGISSGANFISALKSGYKNVVTIFADDNKKYISTKLSSSINIDLLNSVKLLDFKVLN